MGLALANPRPDLETPESFWRGGFGDEYSKRNVGYVEANIALFSQILRRTGRLDSVIELGCGTGQNLEAIERLMPKTELWGVELNELATLNARAGQIICASIFDFKQPEICDLSFTKGVLIHIPPEQLSRAYNALWNASSWWPSTTTRSPWRSSTAGTPAGCGSGTSPASCSTGTRCGWWTTGSPITGTRSCRTT